MSEQEIYNIINKEHREYSNLLKDIKTSADSNKMLPHKQECKLLMRYLKRQWQENKRLNNIINELEKDIENQIIFCTNEANGTTNDKYCRIAINYLKHLKDKLQELKGSDKECM